MAQATLANLGALLKEVYEPRVEKQYVEELTALKRVERTSQGVVSRPGGKYVDFPIKVRRNSGIGNRKENEGTPTAGSQGYAEVHVPLYYSYGAIRVTGQLMELAETNAQAFANAVDEEVDGIKDDRLEDDARQVYGDGTALMATVTADGVNTVDVDNAQYLEVGQVIDIRTIATAAPIAVGREITGISGLTVTYDGADVAATPATDALYRAGNRADLDQREVTGLSSIIDDTGALHNVNPATEPKWAAFVDENGGAPRALSESLMIGVIDGIRTQGGGNDVSVILADLGARRAYFNLLVQDRRYPNVKEYAGGFTGLAFNHGKEIPVVDDPQSPATATNSNMWFVAEKKVKVYRSKPYYFAADDGNMWKWVSGFDAWEALLKQYWEIGTNQRNSHGRLEDLIPG